MDKEDFDIGLSLDDTSFDKYYREEGKEQGEKQKAIEIASKLLNEGYQLKQSLKLLD